MRGRRKENCDKGIVLSVAVIAQHPLGRSNGPGSVLLHTVSVSHPVGSTIQMNRDRGLRRSENPIVRTIGEGHCSGAPVRCTIKKRSFRTQDQVTARRRVDQFRHQCRSIGIKIIGKNSILLIDYDPAARIDGIHIGNGFRDVFHVDHIQGNAFHR